MSVNPRITRGRMPLLPLRALPVNGGGLYNVRIDVRPTRAAYVYVRREPDKKTWMCTVRTLQEILAPSQQARSLDLVAVIMCLYHGIAFDTSSSRDAGCTTAPVELRRREVAFSQPESWSDDGYRLTMRVCVRSSSVVAPVAHATGFDETPMAVIPVVDVAEDDVVVGLNFAPTDVSLDYVDAKIPKTKKRCASLSATATAFPNSYVQWQEYRDTDFLRVVTDGMYYMYSGVDRFYAVNAVDVEVHIVHAKDACEPLFVLSVNAKAARAAHSTTYLARDLHHTIVQYSLKVASRSFLQVVMLPGSACALTGTTITVREVGD